MPDWPLPDLSDGSLPLHISSYCEYSCGAEANVINPSNPASFTWTANLLIFVPLILPWSYPVRRVWWMNGSTVTSNVAVAIYTPVGTRIFTTGSVAQSGASAMQYSTPATVFVLSPGRYYMVWGCDGTTNRAWAGTGQTVLSRFAGVRQQSSFPPPSPATFAALTAAPIPYFGITRTASGF